MWTENYSHFPQHGAGKVLLTCGHWVRVRLPPYARAKLGCTAGMGCGYNFNWVRYVDEKGREEVNPWRT